MFIDMIKIRDAFDACSRNIGARITTEDLLNVLHALNEVVIVSVFRSDHRE